MTATATRDASYQQLTDLGEKQAAVLAVIAERGPVSDRQIAALLEWPINRVNPRRNELVERGLVTEAGVTFDSETGRNVTLWYVISHEPFCQRDMPGTAPLTDCPSDTLQRPVAAESIVSGLTPHRANDITPFELKTRATKALAQRLLQAGEISKAAKLTGFWPGLVAMLYAVETYEELDKEWAKINRYRVSKQPEFETILKIKEQRKQELKNEMR